MEMLARQIDAEIMLGRGGTERAVGESERALEFARNVKDPQALYPTLAAHTRLLALAGRVRRRAAGRRAHGARRGAEFHANRWAICLAFALDDVGRLADGARVFANLGVPDGLARGGACVHRRRPRGCRGHLARHGQPHGRGVRAAARGRRRSRRGPAPPGACVLPRRRSDDVRAPRRGAAVRVGLVVAVVVAEPVTLHFVPREQDDEVDRRSTLTSAFSSAGSLARRRGCRPADAPAHVEQRPVVARDGGLDVFVKASGSLLTSSQGTGVLPSSAIQ